MDWLLPPKGVELGKVVKFLDFSKGRVRMQTKSQRFIEQCGRRLKSSPEFFNRDSQLMSPEEFEGSRWKVLVIFPSTAITKRVSMTMLVMNDWVRSKCPGVFIDFCYLPEREDLKFYDEWGVPYALGNITHLDASHYDMVGFSISILYEQLTAINILSTFNRCDRPIPLTWTERKDLLLGECPIINVGGITGSVTEAMFGDLGDGRVAFCDFIHLGEYYCINSFYEHCIQNKGKVTLQENLNLFWDKSLGESGVSEEASWAYQPQAYEVKMNDKNQIVSNIKINPHAPDMCIPYYPSELPEVLGAARHINLGNGSNVGEVQFMAAQGCSRSGTCRFCHEGSYSGGFVEHRKDFQFYLAEQGKVYSASDSVRPYSFNMNYLTDFKGLIYGWRGKFSKVPYNNMRLDELGRDVDTMRMMRQTGFTRMVAPLEGVSERIRNNFYNKHLSEEALSSYMTYGIYMGALDCKVGLVISGFEEDSDWEYLFNFTKKWREKARSTGGALPIRYKGTLLVHYPHTALYFAERKAVRLSYEGDYVVPQKWNELFKENGIRLKCNGFKHSSFIEQVLIDVGRGLTPWVAKWVASGKIYVYSLRSIVNNEEAWREYKALVNVDYFFNERWPDECITCNHRVYVPLYASVLYDAYKILKDGVNATPTVRCLKSYEGAPVECKASVFKDSPPPIYSDVWIDEKGKCQGKEWKRLKGCERCKSNEERKHQVSRDLTFTKNSDDLIALKAPRVEQKLRFRVIRQQGYEVLNPKNVVYNSMAKFLIASEEVASSFLRISEGHSAAWQSDAEMTYLLRGSQVFDACFKSDVYQAVLDLVGRVNQESKTFRVVDVCKVMLEDKILPTDVNIYYFESTLPLETWQFVAMKYGGEVKVEGAEGGLETGFDSTLKAPHFTLKDRVCGYFAVPCKYSPWNYLLGLMSLRRVGLGRLLDTTFVKCVTTVRESSLTCLCGRERAVMDIVNQKTYSIGLNCLVALMVKNC